MKTLLLVILSCALVTFHAHAAPPEGWTDNYAQAVQQARAEKKYLLLDFTGSDWCTFCKAFDREVLETPQFKAWAKKNVVLVQVDFPHQTPLSDAVKSQNSTLAAKYPLKGYPTVVITDTTGRSLARVNGYRPGAGSSYVRDLETMLKKFGPLPGSSL